MNLLLDTHIWVWSQIDPGRLGKGMRQELGDPANELWISPISIWETMLLFQRGRIESQFEPDRWIREALRLFPLHDAPLTRDVAITSRTIELPHEDPADRFIAATGLVQDLVLATSDQRLLHADACETLANI